MSGLGTLHVGLNLVRSDFALNVDLNLPARGITVLFGVSGSGKTTVLRCVAGLERATGVVALGDELWQDTASAVFKPTWQRAVGYVFQEASLFEHMNVQANLEFGLKRAHRSSAADPTVLQSAIELLGIGHLLGRRSASLSGGERQRVAIARALVTRPRLLLLDEPLASLDLARRQEVLPWLERLHEQLGIPVLYVTHSVDELVRLADHVVMLDRGSVRASAPLGEWMASPEVVTVIGDEAGVVITGHVVDLDNEHGMIRVQCGDLSLWAHGYGSIPGQTVRVRVLASELSLAIEDRPGSTLSNRWPGVIDAIVTDNHNSATIVRVICAQWVLLSRVDRRAIDRLGLLPGMSVICQFGAVRLIA